jgi:rubredoxin
LIKVNGCEIEAAGRLFQGRLDELACPDCGVHKEPFEFPD